MSTNIEHLNINESNALLKAIDDTRDFAIITLFLNSGLFLYELIVLKINSIDWDKHVLHISGNRKRDIILNDQAYEALARWSKERLDVKCSSFFITTKGKAREMSGRNIDKFIKKYAGQAGIKRNVNAQILRNTFAVRLFSKEVETSKAAAILGISDHESINRYIKAAKEPMPEIPEHIDTRPKLVKAISRIFPTKPKQAKPVTETKGPLVPSPEEVLLGRDSVIDELKSNISKNISTLLVGQIGTGKTHILRNINHQHPEAVFISSPTPGKLMISQILDKLNPDWKKHIKTRASLQETLDLLTASISGQPQTRLLIVDNLDRLKISDVDLFLKILEHFTVIAASDDTSEKLKQVWWKFKKIELRPLSEDASRQLIKYMTQNLSISDYEMLETRILTLSNGLPLAIVDMAHQISHQPGVTREKIREVYHEAGIHYRDWTSVIVVLWGVAIMFRFVALLTHSFESYILAGVGIAFISMMRFFAFRMR